MHERYLLWGAAITALAAGVSLGTTLLHLVVTFIATLPIVMNLLAFNRLQGQYRSWWEFVSRGCSDSSWLLIFIALLLLYLSLTPGQRRPTAGDGHASAAARGVG
jgi:hypothetical protein